MEPAKASFGSSKGIPMLILGFEDCIQHPLKRGFIEPASKKERSEVCSADRALAKCIGCDATGGVLIAQDPFVLQLGDHTFDFMSVSTTPGKSGSEPRRTRRGSRQ